MCIAVHFFNGMTNCFGDQDQKTSCEAKPECCWALELKKSLHDHLFTHPHLRGKVAKCAMRLAKPTVCSMLTHPFSERNDFTDVIDM